MSQNKHLLPRLLRLRDAPNYLGMDRHRFDKEVRQFLVEIPIGTQGIAFDRLDLDNWVDYYKQCSGRPSDNKRLELWGAKRRQVSTNVGIAGISTNRSSENEFARALNLTRLKKQKSA